MNKKAHFAILNISNFSINIDKARQGDNLYKLVPFTNFTQLIDLFNVTKIYSYASNDADFETEFYQACNFQKGQAYHLSTSLKSNLYNIYEAIKQHDQLDTPAIRVVLRIGEYFANNDFYALEALILVLQKNFLNNRHLKFYFDLLVDRPVYDWSFLDRAISLLQKNFGTRLFLINSLVDASGIIGFQKAPLKIQKFIDQVIFQKQLKGFNSLQNVVTEIKTNNRIKQFYINQDFVKVKLNEYPIIFFDFADQVMEELKTGVLNRQRARPHISPKVIYHVNYAVNTHERDLKQTEFIANKVAVVSTEARLDPISAMLSDYHLFLVETKYQNNPFTYLFDLANQYYAEFKKSLFYGDIVVLEWNILKIARKFFSPAVWLFALALFNLHIAKIITLLQKVGVKWNLFSTGYGFDRNFKKYDDAKINLLYITNTINAAKEPFSFKPRNTSINSLVDNLKLCLNYKPMQLRSSSADVTIKFNHDLIELEAELKMIDNNNSLLYYINKYYKPTKTADDKEIKELTKEPKKIDEALLKQIGKQMPLWSTRVFEANEVIEECSKLNLFNPYLNIFFRERDLIAADDINFNDLIYFYYVAYVFKEENKQININYEDQESFDNLFLTHYLKHLEKTCNYLGINKRTKRDQKKIILDQGKIFRLSHNSKATDKLFQEFATKLTDIHDAKRARLENNMKIYYEKMGLDDAAKNSSVNEALWKRIMERNKVMTKLKLHKRFNLLRQNSSVYNYNDVVKDSAITKRYVPSRLSINANLAERNRSQRFTPKPQDEE
ncbi:hypothetical protein J2Z62_000034 [Mycoplasmoides fastidiosum]|uniref:Uncharacterized protein n=1 Tax=Mycoplasmoides fastidiosum TaxID=92758 RepID=A0ABU0LY11_9BACT|nr:hypothetical protein [Mycoplasmoides fastidiosum]MDQ0513596.1 hypothetical protein [Mycoplasmoides fastidiosum]UUD37981.1 hypothetical protein NPA10_01125 [Mycoplasmoides fastidiosum]